MEPQGVSHVSSPVVALLIAMPFASVGTTVAAEAPIPATTAAADSSEDEYELAGISSRYRDPITGEWHTNRLPGLYEDADDEWIEDIS